MQISVLFMISFWTDYTRILCTYTILYTTIIFCILYLQSTGAKYTGVENAEKNPCETPHCGIQCNNINEYRLEGFMHVPTGQGWIKIDKNVFAKNRTHFYLKIFIPIIIIIIILLNTWIISVITWVTLNSYFLIIIYM